MKQRITYLLPEGTSVDPADINVGKRSIQVLKAGHAAKEWKVTLDLKDLPDEIQSILAECHELHIRWPTSRNSDVASPLVSRLPPGFHAFFTPRRKVEDVPICDLLHLALGERAKCHSVSETFSKPQLISERFASSPTYQFHQHSSINQTFIDFFFSKLCHPKTVAMDACSEQIVRLAEEANYVDIDFDVISHVVTFTAFWGATDAGRNELTAWRASREIHKNRNEDRLEVGVLETQKATEDEELSMGGYLTVVGEDDHPSRTLFSFPSRHHPLPQGYENQRYRASFQHPTGLHPKLLISLPRGAFSKAAPLSYPTECSLHTYLTLPSTLFIDAYQLSDKLFLQSQRLEALRSLSGEQDLEAPDWVVKRWGSAALLELRQPVVDLDFVNAPKDEEWTATIPLHLRYLASNSTSPATHETVEMPWPIVFWACEAEEGLKMSNNPFDRVNLGYDGLFGPKTMFFHIPPAPSAAQLVAEIKVPVLDVGEHGQWVQNGTLFVVLAGFLWICWKMVTPFLHQQKVNRHKRE